MPSAVRPVRRTTCFRHCGRPRRAAPARPRLPLHRQMLQRASAPAGGFRRSLPSRTRNSSRRTSPTLPVRIRYGVLMSRKSHRSAPISFRSHPSLCHRFRPSCRGSVLPVPAVHYQNRKLLRLPRPLPQCLPGCRPRLRRSLLSMRRGCNRSGHPLPSPDTTSFRCCRFFCQARKHA